MMTACAPAYWATCGMIMIVKIPSAIHGMIDSTFLEL